MKKLTALLALCIGLPLAGSTFAEEVTPGQRYAKATPTPTVWIGFAAAPNGRVFQSDEVRFEGTAREQAKSECEETTGRTCNAIAVPQGWRVSVVKCNGGSFVGGSREGFARDVAKDKAREKGAFGCEETYNY